MAEEHIASEGTAPVPLTFGERAVGLKFNPGGDEMVNIIKKQYADIIDNLKTLEKSNINGKDRLISIAVTEAQSAQMWAVKAITWNKIK